MRNGCLYIEFPQEIIIVPKIKNNSKIFFTLEVNCSWIFIVSSEWLSVPLIKYNEFNKVTWF